MMSFLQKIGVLEEKPHVKLDEDPQPKPQLVAPDTDGHVDPTTLNEYLAMKTPEDFIAVIFEEMKGCEKQAEIQLFRSFCENYIKLSMIPDTALRCQAALGTCGGTKEQVLAGWSVFEEVMSSNCAGFLQAALEPLAFQRDELSTCIDQLEAKITPLENEKASTLMKLQEVKTNLETVSSTIVNFADVMHTTFSAYAAVLSPTQPPTPK